MTLLLGSRTTVLEMMALSDLRHCMKHEHRICLSTKLDLFDLDSRAFSRSLICCTSVRGVMLIVCVGVGVVCMPLVLVQDLLTQQLPL